MLTPAVDAAGRPDAPRVALIGCGKSKLTTRAPALHLYTGGLFLAARDFALATHDEVYVLSALHGLVGLEEELEPYDFTMSDHPHELARTAWGVSVVDDLAERFDTVAPLVTVLAGERYTKWIRGPLKRQGWPEATYPLERLQIGQRLAWLKAALADAGGLPC